MKTAQRWRENIPVLQADATRRPKVYWRQQHSKLAVSWQMTHNNKLAIQVVVDGVFIRSATTSEPELLSWVFNGEGHSEDLLKQVHALVGAAGGDKLRTQATGARTVAATQGGIIALNESTSSEDETVPNTRHHHKFHTNTHVCTNVKILLNTVFSLLCKIYKTILSWLCGHIDLWYSVQKYNVYIFNAPLPIQKLHMSCSSTTEKSWRTVMLLHQILKSQVLKHKGKYMGGCNNLRLYWKLKWAKCMDQPKKKKKKGKRKNNFFSFFFNTKFIFSVRHLPFMEA